VNALDLGIMRAILFQQLVPIAVPIPGGTTATAAASTAVTATSLLCEG
jgi:hypothetical protein